MYNGIGLPTARGSGTNGFVQRNLAHVKGTRDSKPEIVRQPDKPMNGPNFEVVTHQKKREIEAKCFKLRQELEEEGWSQKKIDIEVNNYRQRKLDELSKEADGEREQRLKRSFGIRDDYIEGSAVEQIKGRGEG